MIIRILLDSMVTVFFILGVLFFATTLPTEWAFAVSLPFIALFLVYLKLDGLDASMNEARREIEVLRMDHRFMVCGIYFVLIAIGGIAITTFAGDVRLLPVEETRGAIERLGDISKAVKASSEGNDRNPREILKGLGTLVSKQEENTKTQKKIQNLIMSQKQDNEQITKTLQSMETLLKRQNSILEKIRRSLVNAGGEEK
jgi:hypothetical protein